MRVTSIKFNENSPSGIRGDRSGQTGRYEEAKWLFNRLTKRALKPK